MNLLCLWIMAATVNFPNILSFYLSYKHSVFNKTRNCISTVYLLNFKSLILLIGHLAPHLGRAWGILQIYKGRAFHHTHTHTHTHRSTHTHTIAHMCVLPLPTHRHEHKHKHTSERGCVYKMKRISPRALPWGTPQVRNEGTDFTLLQSLLPLSTCVLSHLLHVKT